MSEEPSRTVPEHADNDSVCIMSIIRLINLSQLDLASKDDSWDFCWFGLWTVLECNVAIASACLPSLRPIVGPLLSGRLARSTPSKPTDYVFASQRSHTTTSKLWKQFSALDTTTIAMETASLNEDHPLHAPHDGKNSLTRPAEEARSHNDVDLENQEISVPELAWRPRQATSRVGNEDDISPADIHRSIIFKNDYHVEWDDGSTT